MERRSVRTGPRLTDFFKVLEGPIHKAAAVSEEGQNSRTHQLQHLGGVTFVPLDEGCSFPSTLEHASPFTFECECHVTEASKVLEGGARRKAGDPLSPEVDLWAQVLACRVVEALHHRLSNVQFKSCPGAEKLYLGKEGRHFLSGVRQEAKVVRVSEDELSAAGVENKSNAGGSLEKPNQGAHN